MVTPPVALDSPSYPEVLDPGTPLSTEFRTAVGARIEAFLADEVEVLAAMGPELVPVRLMAAQLLAGGKRLRPAFCAWGYVAAAGSPGDDLDALLDAAASLDVLHVSALVHDDVMDSSDLRRGRPAAHRQFESLHTDAGWDGDPAAFGRAGAILLGDLLVMWSVQLLNAAGFDPSALARAQPIAEAMRTEVTCGQYLDMLAQARPLQPGPSTPADDQPEGPALRLALEDANRVVEYKAARYTVQRPCQIGAALGGAEPRLHDALAAYGSPLGRAFQFRDDLLGVFGDPATTGKPAGDDLREGKRTVLVAHAYAHATEAGRAVLRTWLGDPDLDAAGITTLQDVIAASGAAQAVESMISAGHDQALTALESAEMTDAGRTGLTALADAAVRRAA